MYRMTYKVFHNDRLISEARAHNMGGEPSYIERADDAARIIRGWNNSPGGWKYELVSVEKADAPRRLNGYHSCGVIVWTTADTRMLN